MTHPFRLVSGKRAPRRFPPGRGKGDLGPLWPARAAAGIDPDLVIRWPGAARAWSGLDRADPFYCYWLATVAKIFIKFNVL